MKSWWWSRNIKWTALCAALAGLALLFPSHAIARRQPPVTNLTVLVIEQSSHKPIFQAHLTLQFRDPKSRLGKVISYSAKTNLQGEYKFNFIPKEAVFLIVTAPNHQTLGKRFQVAQDNQLIQVELRRPQPLR